MYCLECGQSFNSQKALSTHVRKHNMRIIEYKQKHGLERKCSNCGNLLSKNCQGDKCNHCRNRSGSNNPFWGKSHDKDMIESVKPILAEKSRNNWRREEYREKVVNGLSKPRPESFRKEQSERIKEWYANNPEQRDIRSARMRQLWKDGKIEPNINSMNESKLEKELKSLLGEYFADSILEKKCIRVGTNTYFPDIIIDDTVVVEFFGNFWHANPHLYNDNDIVHHEYRAIDIWQNDKKKLDRLSNAGYFVFVVWEDSYRNGMDVEQLAKECRDCLGYSYHA